MSIPETLLMTVIGIIFFSLLPFLAAIFVKGVYELKTAMETLKRQSKEWEK